MKIKIEYDEEKDNLEKLIYDLRRLYTIKSMSKPYINRQPSKDKRIHKRIYIELEI